MTYKEFIDKLNSGCISLMRFRVTNYNHYRNCEVRSRVDVARVTVGEVRPLLIEVQLTKDCSERFYFYGRFDDRHRLFKINKIKYSFKDIWNKIEIVELIEDSAII